MRKYSWLLVGLSVLLMPTLASAVTILTLDLSPADIFQQTDQNPCVLGDPSCKQEYAPGMDLPYTVFAPNPPGDTFTDEMSEVYTVGLIRSIVGGNFFVLGFDINTAAGKPIEILDLFSMDVDQGVGFVTEALYTGPTPFINNNNGTGFSDALMMGFDLTAFDDADELKFTITYRNATGGRENIFLIGTEATPIPEPATVFLVGSALLGLGLLARRRRLGRP